MRDLLVSSLLCAVQCLLAERLSWRSARVSKLYVDILLHFLDFISNISRISICSEKNARIFGENTKKINGLDLWGTFLYTETPAENLTTQNQLQHTR
jgi:hypothetical protein